VENRAEELFSIMQWIDPTVLGNFKTFDAAFVKRDYFGRVRMYRNLPVLHRLISDHMVRRTRAEVADQLPAVVEPSPILIDADAATSTLYARMVRDLQAELAEALNTWGNFSLSGFYRGEDQGEARGRIMSKLVCMRMLCDHPELLRLSAAHYRGVLPGTRSGSEYAQELHQAGRLEKLPKAPKLDATVALIKEILEADETNKVVVFSFFRDMLDLIQEATRGVTNSVLFTGAISPQARDKAKQEFSTDPNTRLFLSSDAGGIGLDLPVANYLISYDLPWSAGAYAQRQSRIIRLSSKWPRVTLLTVQVTGSIEEYQYKLLAQKRKVADAVIDGKGISPRGRLTLDLASLTEWLRESLV
jgi:SNF2 family DNA or RNA helicase